MDWAHRHFTIANDDFLYVLSTSAGSTATGWRPTCRHERVACTVWRPDGIRAVVGGSLALRGRLVRLPPARRRPRFFTDLRKRTHPKGYQIQGLGPERLREAERRHRGSP